MVDPTTAAFVASRLGSSAGVSGGASAGASVLPGVLAAGGSLLASGLSGLFGKKSQEKANATNLQIARENNALTEKMFNQQMDYNSFQNQRKMLEAAGYSPYSLFGTSSVSSSGVPALQQSSVVPEDYFANSLGQGVGNLASTIQMLSQASESNSKATNMQIQNAFAPSLLELQQTGMVSENNIKKAQSIIAQATQQDNVSIVGLQKQLMAIGVQIQDQELAQDIISTYLYRTYGAQKSKWEIAKMQAEAYKLFMEGKLTKSEISYLPTRIKAMLDQIKINEKNATTAAKQVEVNASRTEAQNALDFANASNINYILNTIKKTGSSVEAMKIYELQGLGDKAKYEALTAEEGVRYQQLVNDLLSEQITAAIRNNKWETVTKLFELAGKVMGGSFNYSIQSKQ